MTINRHGIRLTAPQKLWLSAICSKLRNGEPVSGRALRVDLRNSLPKDFDPTEIDYRLLAGEDQITLLGIALVDPTSEEIKKANQVIKSIHDLLILTPELRSIGVDAVSQETKIPKEEVGMIFRKLMRLGCFHDSGTNYGYGVDGLLTINIDSRTLHAYLTNTSLAEIVATLISDDGEITPASEEPVKQTAHTTLDEHKNLAHANQLYDKVKSLVETERTLSEIDARMIVEFADDAIRQFDTTNQEKKVALRNWRDQAELTLPPSTVEELRKRAERLVLKKSYPRNRKLAKTLLGIIAIAIIVAWILAARGNLGSIRDLFRTRSDPSSVITAMSAVIEVTNAGGNRVEIEELCEFFLTEDQGIMIQEYPKGRALLSPIDSSRTAESYSLNAGQSKVYRLLLPDTAGYNQLLERGAANIHFSVRIVGSREIALGSIEFQRDALRTYKVGVKINKGK